MCGIAQGHERVTDRDARITEEDGAPYTDSRAEPDATMSFIVHNDVRVRAGGVSQSGALAEILHWGPDAVYTLESHALLDKYKKDNPTVGLAFIPRIDPTNIKP